MKMKVDLPPLQNRTQSERRKGDYTQRSATPSN
ncbi:hypothetical protein FBY09_10560 [Pseudomonas sp. SJZ101]|nr:hypothetical protein FBY00_10560 [Pseudomonas sp. SJZ075]TWC35409.1 hypothetical protein FBY02_105177 [Pseudomonas sp. SJZ078]TWC56355.1 hypothetical protein FBY11_105177 [Pseudomonas sp. SJZ124]TWC91693.1 hypothetical protein FBY09_10560 [Pseudomonas sp. SJZ101]